MEWNSQLAISQLMPANATDIIYRV